MNANNAMEAGKTIVRPEWNEKRCYGVTFAEWLSGAGIDLDRTSLSPSMLRDAWVAGELPEVYSESRIHEG